MSHQEINNAIVRFESALFANQPEWNTKEEYQTYMAWMEERKAVANQFKCALVDGDNSQANSIIAKAIKQYSIKF